MSGLLVAAYLWCWAAVPNADFYTFYRADAPCGTWVAVVADVYDDTCVLVDNGDPIPGEIHYYIVTASNEHGESVFRNPEGTAPGERPCP